MSRASWLFIFSIMFILIGALHAGEGWLSFFSILIVDGGLAVVWIVCATMLGLALLKVTPLNIPASLRLATAAALGLGIYSLAGLCLGLFGVLSRNTALAFPFISFAAFVATHLPLLRLFAPSLLISRAENWLNTRAPRWWVWLD